MIYFGLLLYWLFGFIYWLRLDIKANGVLTVGDLLLNGLVAWWWPLVTLYFHNPFGYVIYEKKN